MLLIGVVCSQGGHAAVQVDNKRNEKWLMQQGLSTAIGYDTIRQAIRRATGLESLSRKGFAAARGHCSIFWIVHVSTMCKA